MSSGALFSRKISAKLTRQVTDSQNAELLSHQVDDMRTPISRLLPIATAVVTVGLGGCSNTPTRSGVPWWPQGPGNADEVTTDATAREPFADKAERSDSVRTEAPDSVAPSPGASSAAETAGSEVLPASQLSAVPPFARYGDFLFVSGQIRDHEFGEQSESASIVDETRSVMEKLRLILEAEQLTMTNIVSTTILVTNLDYLSDIESAYDDYFPRTRPASSIMEVRRLPGNARIQISAIAGR
jgi:2-iminobutanoate/2-iminopropanoate deaminase